MTNHFEYVHTDIPEGVTIADWQRARTPVLNRRRWWLFLFGTGWKG